MGKIEYFVQ